MAPPPRRPSRRPRRRIDVESTQRQRERATHGLGGEQVEGRQAVRELLAARRRRVREVWIADTLDRAAEPVAGIVRLATAAHVPIRSVGRPRLDDRAGSGAHQGVIAFADPVPDVGLDRLLRSQPQPHPHPHRQRQSAPARPRTAAPPFLLALDGVTDPQNLGNLLRSAEAAGVSGVLLPSRRAAHLTPAACKAAAGAVEHLALALVPGLPNALAEVKRAGLWVVGLDAAGDADLFGLTVATEPVCLVLGAEGGGLSRLVRERCDVVAAIPMRGALASLNVGSAGAIALFEVARARLEP